MSETERKQFGVKREGLTYKPRVGAYGILERDGLIACARIGYDNFVYDLPGGGVDPGETPEQAVVREFGEEIGLKVQAGRLVTDLDHYFIHHDGTPYNNHCHFYEMTLLGEIPEARCEPDHERVWLDPLQALISQKNEGYAWALTLWLRSSVKADGAG